MGFSGPCPAPRGGHRVDAIEHVGPTADRLAEGDPGERHGQG